MRTRVPIPDDVRLYLNSSTAHGRLAVGLLIYGGYGQKHSRLATR